MSLMSALGIAQNGLGVIDQQISVVSDNITNANKAGYTRETYTANYVTNGVTTVALGGAVQSSINENLDKEIVSQNSDAQKQTVLNTYLQAYDNRLGSTDSTSTSTLSAGLNTLSSAISSLSNHPSLSSAKNTVVADAENLASQLNSLSSSLQSARLQANQQIGISVKTINGTLDDLASLNAQIADSTAGTNTAALQNQRDSDLQALSGQIGIQYSYDGNNQLQVYTSAGQQLVSGTYANHLSYTPNSNVSSNTVYPSGFSAITLQGHDITTNVSTGTLGALIQLRDTTLTAEQSKLNAFSNTLQTTVNAALNQGASVPPQTTVTGSTTTNGSDTFSGTGTLRVAITSNTGAVQSYADLDLSAYSSVNDIINALSSVSGVSASIDGNGHLNITSTNPNYGISLNGGTSSVTGASSSTAQGFSAYFGLGNLFDSTQSASDIHVSNYLQANPDYLATGTLNNSGSLVTGSIGITSGDSSAITAVSTALASQANFAAAGNFSAQTGTLSGYVNSIISNIATSASTAKMVSDNSQSMLVSLQNTAASESGVNIDQETANSTVLENAYSATAHVMSTVNSMFQSLLQAI